MKANRLGSSTEQLLAYLQQKELGLPTGIKQVDEQLLGLQGFVGLLGEPKSKKSTLMLQIALHNAKSGVPVRYIDVENGQILTTQRALSSVFDITTKELRISSQTNILAMCSSLAQYPLFYSPGLVELDTIYADVEYLVATYPSKKVLLMIDSLQAVQSELRDIRQSIDHWLLQLDNMKLRYDPNLIIMLTAEKRRGTYGVAQQDAGKESGKLEYRLEQQLDIRNDGDYLILACTENRRGPRMSDVRLQPVMKTTDDPWSFLFKLKALDAVPL